MNHAELTDLIWLELSKLDYKGSESRITFSVIRSEHKSAVKETILAVLNTELNTKQSELEAKVKFYEEMISKSNFKPFIEEGKG